MILHFARSLAVREQLSAAQRRSPVTAPLHTPAPPVPPSHPTPSVQALRASCAQARRPLSIRRDPTDARRTVIAGRFADVCAALDRMALELEPAA